MEKIPGSSKTSERRKLLLPIQDADESIESSGVPCSGHTDVRSRTVQEVMRSQIGRVSHGPKVISR